LSLASPPFPFRSRYRAGTAILRQHDTLSVIWGQGVKVLPARRRTICSGWASEDEDHVQSSSWQVVTGADTVVKRVRVGQYPPVYEINPIGRSRDSRNGNSGSFLHFTYLHATLSDTNRQKQITHPSTSPHYDPTSPATSPAPLPPPAPATNLPTIGTKPIMRRTHGRPRTKRHQHPPQSHLPPPLLSPHPVPRHSNQSANSNTSPSRWNSGVNTCSARVGCARR
jgi:hypothetical protein